MSTEPRDRALVTVDAEQLLAQLCMSPPVEAAQVVRARDHVMTIVRQWARDAVLSVAQQGNQADLLDRVLDPRVLEQNARALTDYYGRNYIVSCASLDEQAYLDPATRHVLVPSQKSTVSPRPRASTSSPFTTQAWQWHGTPAPFSLRPSLHTASNGMLSPFTLQTPVTAAVETSQWLRDAFPLTTQATINDKIVVFFSTRGH